MKVISIILFIFIYISFHIYNFCTFYFFRFFLFSLFSLLFFNRERYFSLVSSEKRKELVGELLQVFNPSLEINLLLILNVKWIIYKWYVKRRGITTKSTNQHLSLKPISKLIPYKRNNHGPFTNILFWTLWAYKN